MVAPGVSLAVGGLPAPDTRWTALAQFIPAFQQTLQYNDNLLGFGPGQGGQLGLPGLHQVREVLPAWGDAPVLGL